MNIENCSCFIDENLESTINTLSMCYIDIAQFFFTSRLVFIKKVLDFYVDKILTENKVYEYKSVFIFLIKNSFRAIKIINLDKRQEFIECILYNYCPKIFNMFEIFNISEVESYNDCEPNNYSEGDEFDEYPGDEFDEYPGDEFDEYPGDEFDEYPVDEFDEYPGDKFDEYPGDEFDEYPENNDFFRIENKKKYESCENNDCYISQILIDIFRYIEDKNNIKNFFYNLELQTNDLGKLFNRKVFSCFLETHGRNFVINLILELNIDINLDLLFELDIPELMKLNSEQNKILDYLEKKELYTVLLIDKSFYCLEELLKNNVTKDILLPKIKSVIENLHITVYDNKYFEKIRSIEYIFNILDIKIEKIFAPHIIEEFNEEIKDNKKYIPFEIIKRAEYINWELYEYLNYVDIPEWLKPPWKEYWCQKINKDFDKDIIFFFCENIFLDEDTKEIYLQIEQSVLFAPKSENYKKAKKSFYKKIN